MSDPVSRASLLARLDALEGHAQALHRAFRDGAFKQDAVVVLDALQAARIALDGAPKESEMVNVQRALDGAVILLAAMGRST
jgi:DNA-binding FrmR family transcriptional regulator